MATMFPPEPPDGIERSEGLVYRALKQLPDSWRVFHSVVWQSIRDHKQGDGEADFIVVSPDRGLIVLEVKGGGIEVKNGAWTSRDANGRVNDIKNPFDQAKKSKFALLKYFTEIRPEIKGIEVEHAVALPNADAGKNIGMYGPRELLIDATDLVDIVPRINGIFDYWGTKKRSYPPGAVERLTDLLAPTVTLRRRLRSAVAVLDDRLITLTEQQKQSVIGMRSWPRAAITGGPGTGKTILATSQAEHLAKEGAEVALLCFNSPLGEILRDEVKSYRSIHAGSFHQFVREAATRAGVRFPNAPDDQWWQTGAPELLVAAAAKVDLGLDALILDEAQDFHPAWFDALCVLLRDRDTSPIYLFADDQQAIYHQQWQVPAGWPPAFKLSINCRNSLSIARRVSAVFGNNDAAIGEEGPRTIWTNVTDDSGDVVTAIQSAVETLVLEELLDPSQIVILSDTRRIVEKLRGRGAAGAVFVELGKHGVVTETIYRFKGLEADAVLLHLSSPSDTDETRRLAYVGMSRAKAVLNVVAEPELRDIIGWRGKG